MAKFHVKNEFCWQIGKSQQQQNEKANIKIRARAGNWIRHLLHRSLECYLSATLV